jgi:hypothetical protein
VGFTVRNGYIRIIGAGYWRKYTDAPAEIERALESATTMDDFLPSPSELVRKIEKEKITIAIDKQSLNLFKQYAKKHNAKYQTMIKWSTRLLCGQIFEP